MLPAITAWEKYSHNSDMTDGIEWSMHISLGRKQFTRAGYCTFTDEYDQMCCILEKLSGHKMFEKDQEEIE